MARVLVPLADGCEELEAVTIIDLLRRAGIEVVVAGLKPGLVRGSRGVGLVPDTTLDSALHEDFDLVALPGGMPGAQHLKDDPRLLTLVQKMTAEGRYTAALCAAPMVLAEAGVLVGRTATAYPGSLDQSDLSGVTLSGEALVRDGTVVTGRGPGTAMDFALCLIELLAGPDKRKQVETALVRG